MANLKNKFAVMTGLCLLGAGLHISERAQERRRRDAFGSDATPYIG